MAARRPCRRAPAASRSRRRAGRGGRPRRGSLRRASANRARRPRAPRRSASARPAAPPRPRTPRSRRPEGTTFVPRWQIAVAAPSSPATAMKRPCPRRATSSRKTRSTGSSAQNASSLVAARLDEFRSRVKLRHRSARTLRETLGFPRCRSTCERSPATTPRLPASRRPAAREVHRRDVSRRPRPDERRARPARLHGHLRGEARLGPGTGMGCPTRDDRLRGADPARREEAPPRRHVRRPAARLRARRHRRRDLGRPGGLDRDAPRRQRAHCPTAELGARPRRRPRREGARQEDARRPVVSSDLFYNPDAGQYERWSERGVLARRDGGGRAVHARRSAASGRLHPHRQRHRRRGRVHAHLRRRSCARPSTR